MTTYTDAVVVKFDHVSKITKKPVYRGVATFAGREVSAYHMDPETVREKVVSFAVEFGYLPRPAQEASR